MCTAPGERLSARFPSGTGTDHSGITASQSPPVTLRLQPGAEAFGISDNEANGAIIPQSIQERDPPPACVHLTAPGLL